MMISALGCGLSLSTLTAYAYCKDNGIDMTLYSWLPLVCLSSFMFLGSIGFFSLPLVIISEILAQKVRLPKLILICTRFLSFFFALQIRGTVITFLTFQSFVVSFMTVKVNMADLVANLIIN
jgi:hypothetical protein